MYELRLVQMVDLKCKTMERVIACRLERFAFLIFLAFHAQKFALPSFMSSTRSLLCCHKMESIRQSGQAWQATQTFYVESDV